MVEYNKELCDERHASIDKAFSRAFKKIDKFSEKLNWFYIISIATLLGVIGNLAKDIVLK